MNTEHSKIIDSWLCLNEKKEKSSQNDQVKKILAKFKNDYKDDKYQGSEMFFSIAVNNLKDLALTAFESSRIFSDSKL